MTKHASQRHADKLLAESHRKRKGVRGVTKRDTLDDAARRAGYSNAEEMLDAQEMQRRQEIERRKQMERDKKAEEMRLKQLLVDSKKELEERLLFKSGMGDRVRAVFRREGRDKIETRGEQRKLDREAGKRVVEENNENTRRINELRQLIKRLE